MGKVVVRRYKGERALQAGINHMAKKGYAVQNQDSRKKAFSVLAGVFTRQQIHTVTFAPVEDVAPPSSTPTPTAPAAPVSVAEELQKLVALHESGTLNDAEFAVLKAKLLEA